jgi:hypothetical protein
MTRFIHAHLHCIFSLLSQRSLRKEAASLNPDQVFLRSREDTEPLTPAPVFRSGRSRAARAEGLRICLPSVFLWQRTTGKQTIPLDRQTRSVHGTEPDHANVFGELVGRARERSSLPALESSISCKASYWDMGTRPGNLPRHIPISFRSAGIMSVSAEVAHNPRSATVQCIAEAHSRIAFSP